MDEMTGTISREEHVEWRKQRARPYLDRNDWKEAFASFVSDMRKESETADHPALAMMGTAFVAGLITSTPQMREWIEGFR